MKRRLFNVLAFMSLLLCVATVVMWVRSYWRIEWLGLWERCHTHSDPPPPPWPPGVRYLGTSGVFTRRVVMLGYGGGRVYVAWVYIPTPAEKIIDKTEWRWEAHSRANVNESQPSWEHLAFSYSNREIAIPQWFILFTAGFLPGWWLFVIRKQRRQAHRQANNLCLSCGYDLRATPPHTAALSAEQSQKKPSRFQAEPVLLIG